MERQIDNGGCGYQDLKSPPGLRLLMDAKFVWK